MRKNGSEGEVVTDNLDVHLSEFLAKLASAGYADKTRSNKRRLIVPFIRWLSQVGIPAKDIDEVCVDAFLACPMRRRFKHRAVLRQFLEYLRAVELLSPRISVEILPAQHLVRCYLDHLRDVRGLCARSIEIYSPIVHAFVSVQRLPEHSVALDASAVRGYLLEHSRNRSFPVVRLLVAALRSFLRFCFLEGVTATDTSKAVPPVHRWQLAAVPPFLTAEEVDRVIAAADRSTTRGCRAFAVLLLLARLGLRAGEIIALELDDIRWEAGEIMVRGKGRRHDRLPLLDDVGEALALYLSTARGSSTSRRVFLRRIAPRVGLSQPSAVSKIARESLRRAGLAPAGRVGAHIFRHSLATRMIRSGASLEEISQVLRHRSTSTTLLYAKVDFEGLRDVALPWPNAEVPR